MKSPFKCINTDRLTLEAVFPLPVDDCPGSVNELVVRVEDNGNPGWVDLLFGTKNSQSDTSWLVSVSVTVSRAQGMLYGAARIRNVQTLELLS